MIVITSSVVDGCSSPSGSLLESFWNVPLGATICTVKSSSSIRVMEKTRPSEKRKNNNRMLSRGATSAVG
jgi:hypothetical protein